MADVAQILTAAQMAAAEQALIAAGTSVEALMEKAGRGAADWVWRIAAGRKVTVLCGPGNNGGDGYVIARVLAERGLAVEVVAPMAPQTEAAKAARAAWGGAPVAGAQGSVFVDCLFGTGLTRPLSQPLFDLLGALASSHDYAIAVDLPSGVDSDRGQLLNDQLPQYDCTLALGAWKFAHWLMPASAGMGARRLVDIGIGPLSHAARLAEKPALSAPARDAQKYTRGLLAVAAGTMPGAAILACRAAMHGGAGYVKLLDDCDSLEPPPDLVCDDRPLDKALGERRIAALLVGPGLGRDEWAKARLADCLAADLPTVADADALHVLSPAMLEMREAPLIVTPHEGELAVLCQTFDVDTCDKVSMARGLADAMGATILAKGPDTIVASPNAPLAILAPGSSWLSIAGTGDVLAGLVASRLATCKQAHQIALEGAALHAEAAHLAGPAFTASTLIDHIPQAFARFL